MSWREGYVHKGRVCLFPTGCTHRFYITPLQGRAKYARFVFNGLLQLKCATQLKPNSVAAAG
jgi:hypothetical protein